MIPGFSGNALYVGGPAHIYDIDQSIRLPQIIQELIPETLSLPGIRHQARHIQQFNRDHPGAVYASGVPGIAFDAQLFARAGGPYITDSPVRRYSGERIVRYLHRCHRRGAEEC
ncbi:hypothetical protein SDC9_176217 [bioreactor metagenome]|uniref:Uncharacterized protein n=1 Tax=bioreactor metagenome TaxID=1076179 RepID=A0A645GS51_9ZZZZ